MHVAEVAMREDGCGAEAGWESAYRLFTAGTLWEEVLVGYRMGGLMPMLGAEGYS